MLSKKELTLIREGKSRIDNNFERRCRCGQKGYLHHILKHDNICNIIFHAAQLHQIWGKQEKGLKGNITIDFNNHIRLPAIIEKSNQREDDKKIPSKQPFTQTKCYVLQQNYC
jgi:hypothetical protein